MLVKCCTQYASQFGKLCMATGLEKGNFHSNPKERQCQKMFKLLHNSTHFTCYQSNAQNSPSQSSTVCEPRPRCSSWIKKGRGTKDQIANIYSVQLSCSVMSDSSRTHRQQKARPFCPSPALKVYSNSCPLSR